MKQNNSYSRPFGAAAYLLRRTAIIVPVSISTGLVVALFLWLLEWVTATRWQHLWLIFLLPLAGVLIYGLYRAYGKNAASGNNLILDEIHEPGGGIPARMTPLIFFTTLTTHLFGGSAGREGTAVQMGGGISFLFAKWFRLKQEEKRTLLMCGMAAGFGAVFGTPVAGAIFALEVPTRGRIHYKALLPCLMASWLAHMTCLLTGITHTHYFISKVQAHPIVPWLQADVLLIIKVTAAGALFGLSAYLFTRLSHVIKTKADQLIGHKWLIPVIGSILILGISYLLGTFDYLGLGVTTPTAGGVSIVNAFHATGISSLSWFWKLLLTAITLGMGFKGGEVTPLFFIGATLGNTLAIVSGSPIDLFAGLGFIAVFAGAANTPLACTLMGIELFGAENTLYFALACFTAYYFSGRSGIYTSQRIDVSKSNTL